MTFIAALALASAVVIQHPSGWQEIRPGGETRCARGAEYAFFVLPGDPAKLTVDFIGGGACWDAASCGTTGATFTDTVDDIRDMATSGNLPGVYATHPDNPFTGYTRLVVPYCTGDVHWGAGDVTYNPIFGAPFVIHHRGAINANAALDWARDNLEAPAQMTVTGCSAGSYGSIYWLPRLREQYPDATVRQLGDAGVGIMTRAFPRDVFPAWNVTEYAPRHIPSLDPANTDWTALTLTDFYERASSFYPDVRFAQYTTAFDFVQRMFYVRMGGRAGDWNPAMQASLGALNAMRPNFRSFIAPYDAHCSTVDEDFYAIASGGVSLPAWLDSYVHDDEAPASVTCGANCSRVE